MPGGCAIGARPINLHVSALEQLGAEIKQSHGYVKAEAPHGLKGTQVQFDRILRANNEPQNWLTYSGSTMSQRYSLLNEITPANVRGLELKWIYQVQSLEKFEATPIVVDGVMYTVSAPNDVIALDAATGRVFWTYSYTPSTLARLCCGRVNRGLAILGHTIFMGTLGNLSVNPLLFPKAPFDVARDFVAARLDGYRRRR